MSPWLPWRTFLSRTPASLAIHHLPSGSSASRKTSGRLSSLYLVGSGCLDSENYSGQKAGLQIYPAPKTRAQAIGRIWQGPKFESAGSFDLCKRLQRIRSTPSVGLDALDNSVSN